MIEKWLRSLTCARKSPPAAKPISPRLNLEILEDRCVLSGIAVQSYNSAQLATVLAKTLAGSGVQISNVSYTGSSIAAGTFTGGSSAVGLSSGIVLDTNPITGIPGYLTTAKGIPTGVNLAEPGDADLNSILPIYEVSLAPAPFGTYYGTTSTDAAVLTFTFVAQGPLVSMSFVFASNEFALGGAMLTQKPLTLTVNPLQDTFAAFLYPGGVPTNEALINGIDEVDPADIVFDAVDRNNDPNVSHGTSPLGIQFDQVSSVLSLTAAVVPGQLTTMKLVIGEVGFAPTGNPGGNASAIFIEAHSFMAAPRLAAEFPTRYLYNPANKTYDGFITIINTGTATLNTTFTDNGTFITGTSGVAFPVLPAGVTVSNPNMTVSFNTGQSYIPLGVALAPGKILQIPVAFSDPLLKPLPTALSGQTIDVQYF